MNIFYYPDVQVIREKSKEMECSYNVKKYSKKVKEYEDLIDKTNVNIRELRKRNDIDGLQIEVRNLEFFLNRKEYCERMVKRYALESKIMRDVISMDLSKKRLAEPVYDFLDGKLRKAPNEKEIIEWYRVQKEKKEKYDNIMVGFIILAILILILFF